MAFKFKSFGFKENMPKYLVIIVAILAAFLLKWAAMPVVFLVYIIVSLAFKNKTE